MRRPIAAAVLTWLLTAAAAAAQTAGPPVLSTAPTPPPGAVVSPAQMSGLPLQVGDLPPGLLSVRVIRQTFANIISGQRVELYAATGVPLASTTDPEGRAQFSGLPVGGMVHVQAVVDGEVLTSQSFEMPARGGVRLVLVASGGATRPADGGVPAALGPVHSTDGEAARLWIAGTLMALTLATFWWTLRRPRRPLA